jgi:hypothetical protein
MEGSVVMALVCWAVLVAVALLAVRLASGELV